MKKEIHLVLVTEDTEVKAIICENITFVPEKPTITTAHSSLVIGEDQTPDYKHLIGKWVKCVQEWKEEVLILGEWYLIKDINSRGKIQADIPRQIYFLPFRFDLGNPKDYRPHQIPAEILDGLMLLPTDHSEYGNIREEAIENAERIGIIPLGIECHDKEYFGLISWALKTAFSWQETDDEDKWNKIDLLAESGSFDPKPIEERIPFDLQRWLDSDYLIIETRVGKEVMFLHNLGVTEWPLVGWIEGGTIPTLWREDGRHSETSESAVDLFLIVKQ